uniref:DNA topoisomerase 2 n=1 Tax=Pithovirus LCPAC403 TaxID=2506596 RepID=A0A481ZB59_9VIRU|nr:MAG: DNA topoisomerase II [Pithovirus LCPAC403]
MAKPKYQALTLREQILLRPTMYINSIISSTRNERLFYENKFIFSTIDTPQAVVNLFLEILMNASDNVVRSKHGNVKTGPIIITMNRKKVMIENGGITIPIENTTADLSKISGHPKELLNPTLIFGHLLTSSNYDDTECRTTVAGQNGLGCKVVSLFSTKFMVMINDVDNGKSFTQTWSDNLGTTDGPKVTKLAYGQKNMVKVIYLLDFDRFQGITEYSDDTIKLFMRHAADISFTTGNEVIFKSSLGTKTFDTTNIKLYASLFPGIENSVTHKQDGIELTLVDSPNNSFIVSFVNGSNTARGGVHIDSVFDVIKGPILEQINNGKTMKMVKGKKTTKFSLTLRDLKPHIGIIMSCKLNKPVFSEQTKEKLLSPKIKLLLSSSIFKTIKKWKLMAILTEILKNKQRKSIGKNETRGKNKNVKVIKADDANYAGTARSHECSLYLTEGLSAAGYIDVYLSTGNRIWRNTNGVYPLRGKFLNVAKATPLKLVEHEEFNGIKTMLGLKEDTDYSVDRNFQTLRYGNVILGMDSDYDGIHIAALILNLFENKWKALLTRKYVILLRTPIIRIWPNTSFKSISFYNKKDYETWMSTGKKIKRIKYYKGLGSSNTKDIQEDYRSPRKSRFLHDSNTSSTIKLVFGKGDADKRKKWLSNPPTDRPEVKIDKYGMDECSISDYLNYEQIQFSITDNERSLAKVTDGFKTSQRKIIWMCKLFWGTKTGEKAKELKIAQLIPKVAEKLGYHYGEQNLADTLVHLAQNFLGTNNLPLLRDDGDYGSLKYRKSWASPRYIFTRPKWYFNLIFRDEDIPLLDYVIDEDMKCEPKSLLSIFPLHLVNGTIGIGTAYSSTIPNHNPIDICKWILAKLDDLSLPELKPWYKGFKGEISVLDVQFLMKPKKLDEIEEMNEMEQKLYEQRLDESRSKHSMISKGVFEEEGDTITVTELPIGIYFSKYKEFLEDLRDNGKIIDYENTCNVNNCEFKITGFKRKATHESLKLIKSVGLGNMVLLDENDLPHRYENAQQIMETFYNFRIKYYVMRKKNMISKLGSDIEHTLLKLKLILLIVEKKYTPMNKRIKLIEKELEEHGIPIETFKKTSLPNCTFEEVEALKKKIENLESQREKIKKIPHKEMWKSDINEFLDKYKQRQHF